MHRMLPVEEIVTLSHFLEGCALLKVWDRCLDLSARVVNCNQQSNCSLCLVLQELPILPVPDSVMPLREDVLLGGPRHLTFGEVLGSVANHELTR